MSDPKEQTQGMIQPEPTEASIVPVPDYPVDPSTGIPISVITTGECPENSLGETELAPITAVDGYEKSEGADE